MGETSLLPKFYDEFIITLELARDKDPFFFVLVCCSIDPF